jgi:hypothetical protein
MSSTSPTRRPTRWIGLGAALLLVAGVGVGVWLTRPPKPAPAKVPELGDEVVDQALGQIPGEVDSAAIKSRWMDEVKGVDLAAVTTSQREIFLRFANAERCTCGCGYTLAACRTYDTTCPVSLPIVKTLLDSVCSGRIRSAVGIRQRPAG